MGNRDESIVVVDVNRSDSIALVNCSELVAVDDDGDSTTVAAPDESIPVTNCGDEFDQFVAESLREDWFEWVIESP